MCVATDYMQVTGHITQLYLQLMKLLILGFYNLIIQPNLQHETLTMLVLNANPQSVMLARH